jgi:hypothetical protein
MKNMRPHKGHIGQRCSKAVRFGTHHPSTSRSLLLSFFLFFQFCGQKLGLIGSEKSEKSGTRNWQDKFCGPKLTNYHANAMMHRQPLFFFSFKPSPKS